MTSDDASNRNLYLNYRVPEFYKRKCNPDFRSSNESAAPLPRMELAPETVIITITAIRYVPADGKSDSSQDIFPRSCWSPTRGQYDPSQIRLSGVADKKSGKGKNPALFRAEFCMKKRQVNSQNPMIC